MNTIKLKHTLGPKTNFRHFANCTKPGTALIETALTGEFLYLQKVYKRTWQKFSHGFEGLMIDDGSDEISCLVGNFFSLSFFLLFTRILGRFFLWWWHKSPHWYILPKFILLTVYWVLEFVVIFSSWSHFLPKFCLLTVYWGACWRRAVL